MSIPASKHDLTSAIEARFAKLEAALDAVPLDHANTASMEGHAKGTSMSPNNLVSYLTGWNQLVLKWLDLDARGQPVVFPDVGYKWNELGPLAQKFYADHADQSFANNRQNLATAKTQLLAEIAKRSDAQLYGVAWHGKWTMGRMIQLNSSSPYENARGRLRRWLKTVAPH